MSVAIADPADDATFVLTWNDLPAGLSLSTVVHTVPTPLSKGTESNTATTSSVEISGGVHGAMYLIQAQAVLSNGDTINRQFPVRIFNG